MVTATQGVALAITQEDLQHAFHHEEIKHCTCIDEGMPSGSVRMAGSGILFPGGPTAVADLFYRLGIKKVTSHEGCGAAALWTKQHGMLPESAEQNAMMFSRIVVNELRKRGVPDAIFEHVPMSKMVRPADRHTATAVYIDMLGGFVPARLPELPLGFVVSSHALPTEYTTHDVELAITIALGSRGLGAVFNRDNPFKAIVVSERDEETYRWNYLSQKFDNRVVVESLVI